MTTHPLTVTGKRGEGPGGASLRLSIPSDLVQAFGYRAGQFVAVAGETGGEALVRQYSLSSVPGRDEELRITVRKIDGGRVSTWLVDEVGPGDVLEVARPRGVFFRPPEAPRHVLLLSAGSGVAPMVPIAHALLASGLGHAITFACGNRTPGSIMLADEIEALADEPGVVVEHVLSRADEGWTGAQGRIDRTWLERRLPDWTARSDLPMAAWLCGPEGFMDAAESALLGFGLAAPDIRRESFDLVLNDSDDAPPLSVAAAGAPGEAGACEHLTAIVGGETIEVVPEEGETILDALLRVSDQVPFSCQEGTCSSCISKITEGAALVRPGVLQTLQESDLADGLTLACLSRPAARRVRIDFDEI